MRILEKVLMPIAHKIGGNRYVSAIKEGLTYTMPFLIVGSFILLFTNLPLTNPKTPLYMEWYVNLMENYKSDLIQPFYASTGLVSIFASFGIGMSLANSYNLNGTIGGFLSIYSFFLTSTKLDWIPIVQSDGATTLFLIPEGSWVPVIDARYLDGKGLFTAIICSILAIEVLRMLVQKNLIFKVNKHSNIAMKNSFELISPIIFVTIIFHGLNIFIIKNFNVLIPEITLKVFKPILNVSDSLPSVIAIILVIHLLWFFGLHGSNIFITIINSITLSNLSTNQSALQAGEHLPKILSGGFLDAFVYLGGAGSTLGLVLAMSINKNQYLKSIGRVSIIPSLFNINDTIIFSSIVMNPLLITPFIGVPVLNACIAWYATKFNIVEKIVALVPWTTPGPIAAFLGTNLNVQAFLLSLSLVGISYICYLPFLKTYEKSLELESKVEI